MPAIISDSKLSFRTDKARVDILLYVGTESPFNFTDASVERGGYIERVIAMGHLGSKVEADRITDALKTEFEMYKFGKWIMHLFNIKTREPIEYMLLDGERVYIDRWGG